MNTYQTFSLGLVLIFGIITSLDEIKNNKVNNWFVAAGIFAGFLSTLIFFSLGWKNNYYYVSRNDLIFYFINFILVFFGGFFLWKAKLINFRIAKIFFMYAVLIPVSLIDNNYLSFFPSLILLINICFLVAAYFIVEFIVFWLKILLFKQYRLLINWKPMHMNFAKKEYGKKEILEYVWMMIGLISVFIVTREMRFLFANNFKIESKDFLFIIVVVLLIIRKKMSEMVNKKIFLVLFLGTVCFFWWRSVDGNSHISFTFVLKGIAFFALIYIFRQRFMKKIIKVFIVNKWRKSVSLNEFVWPMRPTRHFFNQIGKNFDNKDLNILQSININNITEGQVVWLKKKAEKFNIEKIGIQQNLSLAGWMFAGALMTILLSGSIIDFAFKFFRSN